MRYRLRTLMLAITMLSVVLARIAYVKRHRDFHRREVQQYSAQLGAYGIDPARVAELIEYASEMGPGSRPMGARDVDLIQNFSTSELNQIMATWFKARHDAILAKRYDCAMFRPWTRVWEDTNSVPDTVSMIDLRLCATFGIAGALAFGIGWWLDRRFRRGPT
jgi:hypothetical protein